MALDKNGGSVEALFFNYDFLPRAGERVDAIFTISKNNFRGTITPELIIKELSPSES